MQSPPLELVLDVAHLATRNLLRNTGDADGDTISEIIRARVYSRPWGPAAFLLALALFAKHILKPPT